MDKVTLLDFVRVVMALKQARKALGLSKNVETITLTFVREILNEWKKKERK